MKFGLVIPHRPGRESFRLWFEHMIGYQTVQPDAVEVIDMPASGPEPDIRARIEEGVSRLKAARVERVYVWEDDDYYAPDYLERQEAAWGEGIVLQGVKRVFYYHLPTFSFGLLHVKNPALFVTGFKVKFWNVRKRVIGATEVNVDNRLWAIPMRQQKWRQKTRKIDAPVVAVGMKHGIGLCGGKGHHPIKEAWMRYSSDSLDRSMLRALVKDDTMFSRYIDLGNKLRQ